MIPINRIYIIIVVVVSPHIPPTGEHQHLKIPVLAPDSVLLKSDFLNFHAILSFVSFPENFLLGGFICDSESVMSHAISSLLLISGSL
jgi:hypothetical protein